MFSAACSRSGTRPHGEGKLRVKGRVRQRLIKIQSLDTWKAGIYHGFPACDPSPAAKQQPTMRFPAFLQLRAVWHKVNPRDYLHMYFMSVQHFCVAHKDKKQKTLSQLGPREMNKCNPTLCTSSFQVAFAMSRSCCDRHSNLDLVSSFTLFSFCHFHIISNCPN